MWGHDFRPDYLFIRRALDALGTPAILGMTATATPATEREIAEALGREPEVVRTSVVRPNLRYDVEIVDGEDDRVRTLVRRLHELRGASAIVYARSRKGCEKLARTLRVHDLAAIHYHAGMEPEERAEAQEAFIEGRVQTVVATTAFGMGIDKPDIRLVALYNYPESLESYVQMVGRAGRDGRASDTLLLASRADATTLRKFARSDIPSVADLRSVYGRLRGRREITAEELGGDPDPRVLVGMLEQAGLVRRGFDAGRAMQIEVPDPPAGRRRADRRAARPLRARRRSARAERLVQFAESRGCRHRQVAEHFGETLEEDCGMCDVCSPLAVPETGRRADRAAAGRRRPGRFTRRCSALRWPLGRTGLTALLRGSPTAPRSAQRSPSFGALAAASQADIKRWIQLLELAGALEQFESEDGFRLLRAVPGAALPAIGAGANLPPDDALFERLRAWRSERARTDEVPAYVVLHDATLRELAASKPQSPLDLAAVKGFGPTKLERYAEDVLAVIGATRGLDWAAVRPLKKHTKRARKKRRIRKLRLLGLVTVLGLLSCVSFSFGLVRAIASEIPKLDPQRQLDQQVNGYIYDSNRKSPRVLAVLRGSEARTLVDVQRDRRRRCATRSWRSRTGASGSTTASTCGVSAER